MERAAVIRIGLMFCTPATVVTMIGKTPWLTPNAILDAGPMPKYRMNSGRMVTWGVPYSKRMIGMKLRCENFDRPTASPTIRPIKTDIANATASSQNVTRSAAGMPRVSNMVSSEVRTCDGGLRKMGSTHQRAAPSHRRNSAIITRIRARAGWHSSNFLIRAGERCGRAAWNSIPDVPIRGMGPCRFTGAALFVPARWQWC
jgi:hypothetical protein